MAVFVSLFYIHYPYIYHNCAPILRLKSYFVAKKTATSPTTPLSQELDSIRADLTSPGHQQKD
jgi:hypothetical protein